MKADQYSRTAEAAAAARAWHLLDTTEPVFEDPFAVKLLSPLDRWRVTSPLLRSLQARLLGELAPMAIGQVNLRSRYTEDALAEAVTAGFTQYLLLAAGLDTFALRRPDLLEVLRVFEVDHPASQADKRARLQRIGEVLPAQVVLVPVDFEREGVVEGLAGTTFDPQQRTFVSWLGTVPYLSEAAIFSTVDALAELLAAGSELVLDFGGPVEGLGAADRAALEKLQRFTARRGEPLRTYGPVEPFVTAIHARGFETVELLTPAEQEQRYRPTRGSGIRTLPVAHLVRFRRA